jgi:hypothetical protein
MVLFPDGQLIHVDECRLSVRTTTIMRDEHDFSAGKPGPVKRPPADSDRIVDLPIVCTLTPATIATRKAALLPGLVVRAERREETAAGIRLRLPADALSTIVETVDAERQCCRFLRFDITIEPDGGPIWLELAGPPGTREFLSALLES